MVRSLRPAKKASRRREGSKATRVGGPRLELCEALNGLHELAVERGPYAILSLNRSRSEYQGR
jgi:hypothetical protein